MILPIFILLLMVKKCRLLMVVNSKLFLLFMKKLGVVKLPLAGLTKSLPGLAKSLPISVWVSVVCPGSILWAIIVNNINNCVSNQSKSIIVKMDPIRTEIFIRVYS